MIRLITISAGGEGYLNFIGNEFGHPDWIDFPREGNNWSYRYARRQWSLNQASYLKYHYLSNFDKAMLYLANKYNICTGNATLIVANHKDQVLAYQKAGLIFVFNFSPTNSYPSFGLLLGTSAKYKEALSTQHAAFGGHNLIDPETEYFTSEDGQLKVYIPARSALVLYNADAY